MKKIFLFILVIVALGCSKEAKIPDDVIPTEKMVGILIDVHLLEEKIQYMKLDKDSALMLFNAYEFELLKEHKVDTTSYDRSYKYYSNEVRAMSRMYEAVVDSLNARHKRLASKSKVDNEGEPVKRKRPRKNDPTNKNRKQEDE